MSVQTVVAVVESVLLAVALLFLVALLRSHAEILRRLIALEGRSVTAGTETGSPAGPAAESDRAPDQLRGETLSGDVVQIALGAGGPRTLLAFLSSGCGGCAPLWAGLRDGLSAPAGTRVLTVTKGPDRESPARLRSLGPFRHEVIMSGTAFSEFAIPATPHFVLVGGDGAIQGRGSAGTWEQLLRLLGDADADAGTAPARTSSERAARAERALAAAGIDAGHPSLYPSGRKDES